MPKRTNEFQTIVFHAFAHLAGPQDRVTESATIRERGDGAPREVDILVEHRAVGVDLRIALECRGRKDKDDIEWVDALVGKFKDLDVDKVVAVSRSGFSRAALKKAKDNRIEPLTLEPVTDQGWPSELMCPALGGWSRTDHPQKIGVITDPPYPSQVQINQAIFQEDGVCIGSLGDLGWALCRRFRDEITDSIQARFLEFFKQEADLRSNALTAVLEIPLPFQVFLDHDGKRHRIVHIQLTIRCDFDSQRVGVEHYALGDARLTVGTVPCGKTERAYSVTAIQAANKPGEFRVCSVPAHLSSSADNEHPPGKI